MNNGHFLYLKLVALLNMTLGFVNAFNKQYDAGCFWMLSAIIIVLLILVSKK